MPKICDFETCRKYANYGEYYGKPFRCKEHKCEYKLVSNLCQAENCKNSPSYNYCYETKRLYCFEHKLNNMINIKDIKNLCTFEGCSKRANYNYENLSEAIYCCQHKLDNMFDVNHKRCLFEGCKIRPSFNYNGEKNGLYCKNHKLDNMIDISNKKRKCNYKDCDKIAVYNFQNSKSEFYCKKHKLEIMINVVDKKCKGNYCLGSIGNKKYKGYCAHCYQNLFPNDPLTLQIRCKTKEIAVRDYLILNFDGFIHDNPLWTGNCECSHRRRIDFRKLIGNTLLCIEVDENQHKGYNEKQEEIRYDDLYMLHGGKFIFIRFNPDKFKDKNNKSVNPMLYTRLPILKEEIEKQIKRIENDENKELLEIFKLYYDEIKN